MAGRYTTAVFKASRSLEALGCYSSEDKLHFDRWLTSEESKRAQENSVSKLQDEAARLGYKLVKIDQP